MRTKNYLFAPFNDDDETQEAFNAVINAINYVVDAEETHYHETALHGLRVFIGRLESTHDVEINKLLNRCAIAVADERIIKELQTEIRQLKADIKHDADVCYEVDDDHIKEIDALKEQVNDLMIDKDNLKEEINARLVNQVGSNCGNSSSTHTHTISKEIAEYMSYNEGCGGARMFLIPRDEFNNDEYNNTIYWDDGIE